VAVAAAAELAVSDLVKSEAVLSSFWIVLSFHTF
jgi:hypothetical protein